ncbi:hypothetical protein AB0E77_22365 [Streptomyces sp. NPDC032940]|uniref:hypothetical protein n=1 Tax=Streptomyces sp. NPDC032940 TaxID=3155366 RepID=UPI0033F973A7
MRVRNRMLACTVVALLGGAGTLATPSAAQAANLSTRTTTGTSAPLSGCGSRSAEPAAPGASR